MRADLAASSRAGKDQQAAVVVLILGTKSGQACSESSAVLRPEKISRTSGGLRLASIELFPRTGPNGEGGDFFVGED